MAAGLPLPRRISSNGWWIVEGEKMSKSLGNVIEPRQLAETYRARPGALLPAAREAVRRRRQLSATSAMVTRINVELANDLGNLAQRSLSLIARNCDGRLPGEGACHRGRRGAAGGGGCAAGPGARPAGPPGLPRGAGGSLEGHPRRQRLHRPPGALGAAPDRPGADGRGAARAGRRAARDRHRAAAVHAGQHGAGCSTSSACRRMRATAAPIWRTAVAGWRSPLPAPQGVFPALRRARRLKSHCLRIATDQAPMLIDSHCHLDYFTEAELPDVLARAAAAGVGEMVTIGTTLAQSRACRRWPRRSRTLVHRRRASAPRRRSAGSRARSPRRDDRPSAGHRHRRIRARLLLRPVAARRAAGQLPRPHPCRAAGRSAACHPCPRR